MDQKLDAIGKKEIIRVFHQNKTKMSCMANPHIFLSQLKDHDLIPEDKYKEMRHKQRKETLQRLLYDYLDWFEKERSEDIKKFWSCVFQDKTLNHYRELQELHADLIGQSDGPKHVVTQPPKRQEDAGKREEGGEKKQEQPSPSCKVTSSLENTPKKISTYSDDQLPVTCGIKKGMLNRKKLAIGPREKCIKANKQWLTPKGFADLSVKNNWYQCIQSNGIPLGQMIKEGQLEAPWCKNARYCYEAETSAVPTEESTTGPNQGVTQQEREDAGKKKEKKQAVSAIEKKKVGDTQQDQPDSSAPALVFKSPEKSLRRFRPDFIRGMSQPNLDQVLDKLLEERVINQEEMQSTKVKAKADKARDVIDMAINKGAEASEVLITIIYQLDPYLSNGLKRLID